MTTPPDRDLLTLLCPAGKSSALIDLHGAQVLSWLCDGVEQLFLSPAAAFVPGQAVRGGIPVIFPQFGTFGPGLRHGFARLRTWEHQPNGQGNVSTLTLWDDAETRVLWPHPFRVTVSVALPEEPVLRIGLQVTNPGPEPFEFTCALHTYLGVGDIGLAGLCGLEGLDSWIPRAGGGPMSSRLMSCDSTEKSTGSTGTHPQISSSTTANAGCASAKPAFATRWSGIPARHLRRESPISVRADIGILSASKPHASNPRSCWHPAQPGMAVRR